MLTAKKLESAGIVMETVKDGDVVVSITKHGAQMICGLCGDTSGLYASTEQARAVGESHECPEPVAAEWDQCFSCGGVCPVGGCTSSEDYDGPFAQPGTTKRR